MKITFLGGADEVGASGMLVETGGRRVLIDCGIRPSPRSHQGLAADQLPNLSQIEGETGRLDAILVTHAHTDHTGALELVVERFPEVPVYATAPTLALIRILHQDARRIMQSRLDEEGELPLFDDVAVERLMAALVPVPFQTRLPVGDGLAVTFFPAGHIAGAAMLGLESEEGRLLVSGDLSISAQRTVDGARPPAFHPDALVLESTYGGKLHANRAVQERNLVETVAEVTAAGGKVLIPAFALGRAQEVLLILNEYMRRGELAPVPVWADGMVRAICQAYPSFGEALPLALQEQKAQFFNEHIHPIQNAQQRSALIFNAGPAVIVSSSGMLAGGPSLTYARALAGKPEHAILLTGYQDEESPGRRLQELGERGMGTLRLGGDKVDVHCRIATYALSAHADEGQLISLTETLDPEHVFLVHGDLPARQSLEKALSQRGRIVYLPKAGQTLELQLEKRGKFIRPDLSDDPRRVWEELARQRRAAMSALSQAAGKWLLLKSDPAAPVRCIALQPDHLWIEIAPGLEQAASPEEVLAVFGESYPTPAELEIYQVRKASQPGALMESNQALSFVNSQFPPSARLRKSGYRLDLHTLTLTFDFPEAARQQFSDVLAALPAATGWAVEVTPETNQSALNALIRELLPRGAAVVKGPAIHRDLKKVAVTVSVGPAVMKTALVQAEFKAISGWDLALIFAAPAPPGRETLPTPARSGDRLEINDAYAVIKATLEGSTLYRASLKGTEIVLSFISPQVGGRYGEQIALLAEQTGYPLRINPQPNQGGILEIARVLLNQAGLIISKGPSIYPEKAEVSVSLANLPDDRAGLEEAFQAQTGYRLVLNLPQEPGPGSGAAEPSGGVDIGTVEIPLNRIRLTPYQQTLRLDPEKLEKAIQRARSLGISPPIQVKRTRDGYVLVDGLYRVRVAEALGLERIPARVE